MEPIKEIFKFKAGDKVTVPALGLNAVVNMAALGYNDQVQYILEWIDTTGKVNTRWFEESRVVLNENPAGN